MIPKVLGRQGSEAIPFVSYRPRATLAISSLFVGLQLVIGMTSLRYQTFLSQFIGVEYGN
jgi:hypothetical protein